MIYRSLSLGLVLAVTFGVLHSKSCPQLNGGDVGYILPVATERGYSYCKTLKRALDSNSGAIREFSLYEFNDAMGYTHGANIVALVKEIGEANYAKAIVKISESEKQLVEGYFSVGIQYSNLELGGNTTIESVFPYLAHRLK